ncbi:MAG TPA: vanadium-dependent haloperoxidase [Thermoanaerobaculia bacterium]
MTEPTASQPAPSTEGFCKDGADTGPFTPRQKLSYCTRVDAAKTQILNPPAYDVPDSCPPNGCTPDEVNFQRYAASFHKLMEHDAQGLLTAGGAGSGTASYRLLLKGLKIDAPSSDFDHAALNAITLLFRHPPAPARPRVLINPQSGKSLSIKGPDIVSLDAGKILYGPDYPGSLLDEISLSSEYSAAEMVEIYAMALLRGLALHHYQHPGPWFEADVDLAVAALNELGAAFVWGYPRYQRHTAADLHVTPDNLFRGPTDGDQQGPYLSVFLTFDDPPLFPSGCAPHVADLIHAGQFAHILSQPLRVPQGKDKDFGITMEHYVKLQNAEVPEPYPPHHFSGLGPLVTGRNLGELVHVDNAYDHFIRAANILTGHEYPLTPHSPYGDGPEPHYPNESDGPTLGPGDAFALVGGVRGVAERAAWAQKYLVARKARPEVMAALIHLAKNGNGELRGHLSPLLFAEHSAVGKLLERVRKANYHNAHGNPSYDTDLLPQMFPEASPDHPSWPSGHATIAGACATVLKAIFDDCQKIIDPDSPPSQPRNFTPEGATLTVGGELDKLASNIAFGRNFAGVHFRSDGEHGILIGEEVAIHYLQDHLREYREEFRQECGTRNFTFTKRNGVRICITPDSIKEIEKSAPKEARIHPISRL